MEDVRTQARLVEFSPARFAGGGLGTMVPRAEIAAAAALGEYPARLVLDVGRVDTSGSNEVTAHAQVAVDWDEATLEQLLQSAEDEEIALWFDPIELARVIEESEVDAHGLRERAAVLAVAVAAAGATAGAGLAAAPSVGTAPALPAVGQALIPDLPAGQTLQPQAAVQPDESIRPVAPTGQAVIPDLPAGQTLQPQAAIQPDASTRPVAPTGQAVIPDLPAGQTLQPAVTPSTTSSGSAISMPSPGETAGIAAGVALLISAAGFTLTRSRTRPSRPA
jgi:hypothetical protein